MRTTLVVNPTKVEDVRRLRRRLERRCDALGFPEPTVLETTVQDPGEGMARTAVADGAELVLPAGGDGTVMSVARGLAGTGVPMGILPIGTGNLLARNLGLPLDLPEAIQAALCGQIRRIDLGRVRSQPASAPQGFTVMAGLGFDANMMADAPTRLKDLVGWPAYLVSGVRHLRDEPMTVELRLDDGPPMSRRARGVIVGNVGTLQGGLRLLPAAVPDDGLLDVVVLSPDRLRDWARMVLRLATRSHDSRDVERFQARRVELRTTTPQRRQLDGDPDGTVDVMLLEIDPGALLIRVAG